MIKILILSRNLKMQGGVVNLIQTISEKLSNKIKIEHLFIGKNIESKGVLGDFFKPLVDSARIFKQTKNNHYDVIHINPSLDIKSILRDGFFMLIINTKKSHKTLVFFHGWDEKLSQVIRNSKLLCFLMRKTYGKAGKIIVLAEKFANQLVDMGMEKNQLIQLSTMFDGSMFNGVEKQRSNKIILLFMSRFVVTKGIFELLHAFNEIQIHYSEVVLHLVGDGPEKTNIEKNILELELQQKVKLLGYIKGKEKAQELVNADVFILPSYTEGCPISLLEAMAAELPVITTSVGGIPDIIIDGKNGILLTNHTADEIKEGMKKMLDNKVGRKEIGKLNRKVAWENYESRIVTSKIEKIYKQVSTHG